MKTAFALGALLVAPLVAEERSLVYPFDVTLGGTKAEMKAGNEVFAEVSKPVAADAVVALDKQVPVLWVNVFTCAEDGTVEVARPAAVILARNEKDVKLDATLDKKKLAPGTYLATVEAEGKTSTIVFVVAAPDAKPAVDFSKVLGFLRKKAGGE